MLNGTIWICYICLEEGLKSGPDFILAGINQAFIKPSPFNLENTESYL